MKTLKKISLIIAGIILSLILLEAGLQIAGITLTAIKKHRNKITKNPNTITILCLGESTTDGQWPPILQKILNEKSPNKKFNVIDEGHIAKNTEYLFHEVVEKKLLEYNPDIVISMIGTNDASSDKPYIMQNEHWYYKLRIYRLIILIKDHILGDENKYAKFNNTERNYYIPKKVMEEILKIARNNDKTKDHENLHRIEKIIKKYPNINWFEHILPALINPYFNDIVLKKEPYIFSLDEFLTFYNIDEKQLLLYFQIGLIYVQFARKFLECNDMDNAVRCAKTALIYNDYYNSVKDILLFDDGKITVDKIKYDLKDEGMDLKNSGECITYTTYNYIINYVFKNSDNIEYYIVMQYPTLPLEELKYLLKDNPYYDNLIFISNEENFKQALKQYKTNEVFRDMFGCSWGHCTELGNTLIAENVAETILKLYN